MGSAEMCRDLATEVEKLLLQPSSYVRKKVRQQDHRHLPHQKLSFWPCVIGGGSILADPCPLLSPLISAGCSDCSAYDPEGP